MILLILVVRGLSVAWFFVIVADVNIGFCETNNLILDDTFVWYYQRAYVSMYVICLYTVKPFGRHS